MDTTTATTIVDQIAFFTGIALKGEIPEDARFYQTKPDTAHIHWLVGHLAFTMDRIAMSGLEGSSVIPDALQPVFGWGTKPTTDKSVYPSWDETVGSLNQAIDRLKAHVSGLSADQLARPLPEGHPFAKFIRSQGAMISFAGMHATYHLGQLSLLRRAQGLPSGMSM